MWLALSFPGKSLTFLEVILRLIIYLVPMTRAPSSLFSGLYLGLRVAGWQPPGSTSEVEGNLMLCSSPSNSQISYGLLCPLPVPSSLMWTLVWWLHKPRPKCFRWPIWKWVIMPSLCTFALTLAFFTRSCQNSVGPFICIHRNSPVLITPETMCFLCSIKYFSYAVHSLNTQINNARYGNRKKVKLLAQDHWWCQTRSTPSTTLCWITLSCTALSAPDFFNEATLNWKMIILSGHSY